MNQTTKTQTWKQEKRNKYNENQEWILAQDCITGQTKRIDSFVMLKQLIKNYPSKAKQYLKELE